MKAMLMAKDADANGITWPKSHVAPHFSCLNVGNVMVPLIMLLAQCDTDANVNGVKWL